MSPDHLPLNSGGVSMSPVLNLPPALCGHPVFVHLQRNTPELKPPRQPYPRSGLITARNHGYTPVAEQQSNKATEAERKGGRVKFAGAEARMSGEGGGERLAEAVGRTRPGTESPPSDLQPNAALKARKLVRNAFQVRLLPVRPKDIRSVSASIR